MKTGESIYEPVQEGLIFPRPQRFDTVADERQHLKERLAGACRIFARQGFSYGFGGHLTVRDPEHSHLYWTNPVVVPFSGVKVSELVLADHGGKVIEGRHAVNRAGFVLHGALHEKNSDIVASVHAHTVEGAAWSAMGQPLSLYTQDACQFFEDQVIIQDGAGAVPVDDGSGGPLATLIGHNRIAVHQNHGIIACSRHSLGEAVWAFIAYIHACKVQFLIDSSQRRPISVPEDRARQTREHLAHPLIGWLCFETYFQEVLAAEPDLLD